MILTDLQALTPPGLTPEEWGEVEQALRPSDTPVTTADRLGWLKKLVDEPSFGQLTVRTTREGFYFWRLAPESVEVHDLAGKKLSKTWRTDNIQQWAQGVIVSDHRKSVRSDKFTPQQKGNLARLITTFAEAEPPEQEVYTPDGQYILVQPHTQQWHQKLILQAIRNSGKICFDTETDQTEEEDLDAPNPWTARLVGISISAADGRAWYFPLAHQPEVLGGQENLRLDTTLTFLHHALTIAPLIYGHNLKYDFTVLTNPLHRMPIEVVYDFWLPKTMDTMLMAAVGNYPSAKLKILAETVLNLEVLDYKKLTGGKPFSYLPLPVATIYAGQDADWPLRLFPILWKRADQLEQLPILQTELQLIEYFLRIERRGVKVDTQKLQDLTEATYIRMEFFRNHFLRVCRDAGLPLPDDFKMGSTQQLVPVLFDPVKGLGLPVPDRTPTGAPSTNKKALNKLSAAGIRHPAVEALRNWRKQEKTRSYCESLAPLVGPDGRYHDAFHQVGAATGRTTATLMQVLPKTVRKCMIPEPDGQMAGIDYGQIELRVLGVEFNEPRIIEAYRQGRDLHEETNIRLRFEDYYPPDEARKKAKNFNFGKSFGGGANTLSETAGIPLVQAQHFSQLYDEAYPDLTMNKRKRIMLAVEQGEVRNWKNRVRILPPATNSGQEAANERLVMNTPVQGGALDIIKEAMVNLLPVLRAAEAHGIHPFNMVHDELDFECEPTTPPDEWKRFLEEVARVMSTANPWPDLIDLPTDTEIGTSWGDLRIPELEEAD